MRERMHFAATPATELDSSVAGMRFANFDPSLIEPSLVAQPTLLGGGGAASAAGVGSSPHHGVIGLVLIAVLILALLDKAGFRFAVTVGKR